ncbi:hypothetical protein HDV03_000931 [Kappamyces sp. JEL0829]|nr:hypothetical protein HDV03_000931 [Kappamyces sp. JEL0829]
MVLLAIVANICTQTASIVGLVVKYRVSSNVGDSIIGVNRIFATFLGFCECRINVDIIRIFSMLDRKRFSRQRIQMVKIAINVIYGVSLLVVSLYELFKFFDDGASRLSKPVGYLLAFTYSITMVYDHAQAYLIYGLIHKPDDKQSSKQKFHRSVQVIIVSCVLDWVTFGLFLYALLANPPTFDALTAISQSVPGFHVCLLMAVVVALKNEFESTTVLHIAPHTETADQRQAKEPIRGSMPHRSEHVLSKSISED